MGLLFEISKTFWFFSLEICFLMRLIFKWVLYSRASCNRKNTVLLVTLSQSRQNLGTFSLDILFWECLKWKMLLLKVISQFNIQIRKSLSWISIKWLAILALTLNLKMPKFGQLWLKKSYKILKNPWSMYIGIKKSIDFHLK